MATKSNFLTEKRSVGWVGWYTFLYIKMNALEVLLTLKTRLNAENSSPNDVDLRKVTTKYLKHQFSFILSNILLPSI